MEGLFSFCSCIFLADDGQMSERNMYYEVTNWTCESSGVVIVWTGLLVNIPTLKGNRNKDVKPTASQINESKT